MKNNNNNNANTFMIQSKKMEVDFSINMGNAITCIHCNRKFDVNYDSDKIHYLLSEGCLHPICKSCLVKRINSEFVKNSGNINCNKCGTPFSEYDYITGVGKEKYEELNWKVISITCNLIKCTKCNQ